MVEPAYKGTTASAREDEARAPQRSTTGPTAEVYWLPDATVFTEARFMKRFNAFVAASQYEAAANYLVDLLPRLSRSKLNIKEKINHLLYMSRIIQRAGHTKHGYNKLLRKAGRVERQIAGLDLPRGGGFLEVGCGAHDPVGLATYYYLNGFDSAHAVDVLPPRNTAYSAYSMYDILAHARLFPQMYCRHGVSPRTILMRSYTFDIGKFECGDFWGGLSPLRGQIKYEVCDASESTIEAGSLSLACSFAVLEHVADLPAFCAKLYDALMPGGIAFHFVDLADHRAYRVGGPYHPLSFLTEETAPPNLNRIRAHEQIEIQLNAGFDLIREKRGHVAVPDKIRTLLQPQFAAMKERDMSAIKLSMVLRKPARQI